jgi:hypothetical protein
MLKLNKLRKEAIPKQIYNTNPSLENIQYAG